jgi:hypothetical protein
MKPSGIEPATFRFVAKYLNHCATISGPGSLQFVYKLRIKTQKTNINPSKGSQIVCTTNITKFYTLWAECIYVFCMKMNTSSNYLRVQN